MHGQGDGRDREQGAGGARDGLRPRSRNRSSRTCPYVLSRRSLDRRSGEGPPCSSLRHASRHAMSARQAKRAWCLAERDGYVRCRARGAKATCVVQHALPQCRSRPPPACLLACLPACLPALVSLTCLALPCSSYNRREKSLEPKVSALRHNVTPCRRAGQASHAPMP
jgi:hypothetical protein